MLLELCTSLQWHLSKGKACVKIISVLCTQLIALRDSEEPVHTRSLQESAFIMETFSLLLLLNNPQLGLSSLSLHLFRICSKETKSSHWKKGRKALALWLTH